MLFNIVWDKTKPHKLPFVRKSKLLFKVGILLLIFWAGRLSAAVSFDHEVDVALPPPVRLANVNNYTCQTLLSTLVRGASRSSDGKPSLFARIEGRRLGLGTTYPVGKIALQITESQMFVTGDVVAKFADKPWEVKKNDGDTLVAVQTYFTDPLVDPVNTLVLDKTRGAAVYSTSYATPSVDVMLIGHSAYMSCEEGENRLSPVPQ